MTKSSWIQVTMQGPYLSGLVPSRDLMMFKRCRGSSGNLREVQFQRSPFGAEKVDWAPLNSEREGVFVRVHSVSDTASAGNGGRVANASEQIVQKWRSS